MRIENPLKHPVLRLAVPETWTVRPAAVTTVGAKLQEIRVDDAVSLEVRTLVAPIAAGEKWVESRMLEDISTTQQAKRVASETTKSLRGWPVTFAHYTIHDGSGTVVEERAGVFYRLVHSAADVVARLVAGVRWEERKAVLLPIMMAGEIVWPEGDANLLHSILGIDS